MKDETLHQKSGSTGWGICKSPVDTNFDSPFGYWVSIEFLGLELYAYRPEWRMKAFRSGLNFKIENSV
jgi:hypothetical protein